MAITLKYKQVKIRKTQNCYSCLRKFEPGIKMTYWVGIYEGDFGACYCCDTCSEIMKFNKDEYEYSEGYVDEMLNKGQTPEQLLNYLIVENTK